MNLNHTSSTILLSLISLIFLSSSVSGQTCQRTCGKQPIKYPFGTGTGCGDPRFQKHVTCDQTQTPNQLTLSTHTGCYPITYIDYTNQVLYVSDPTMSTCACARPSKGFGLDWDAPFAFQDNTIFALLDCSTSSSPIYKSSGGGNYSSAAPLCDTDGASVCSLLYSCQAVSRLNVPISTCCVYTPVDLGPEFEMDLQKLRCSSYSGIYGFDGRENDPESWYYGVALKYKFNFDNAYPALCASCERSNGVCGYTGPYNTFVCNCLSGINTTTDCYFAASWNNGLLLLPWKIGTWLLYCLAWFLVLM
ncbi:wall-associated receptor kinase-like 15 [Rhododendron vialii]|uniref:wall-associated receptor kinase-like 15 n=1 Tax=Rhododendron vialii TaxID=182163 RepID=UPI00265D6218|nr:wall-associated receptor kinase-like 15 [Rhododendron vialii]